MKQELTAGVLKTDPKAHKRLERMLFNQTKQDRTRIFEEILFSKLRTIQKQTAFCRQLDSCGRTRLLTFWVFLNQTFSSMSISVQFSWLGLVSLVTFIRPVSLLCYFHFEICRVTKACSGVGIAVIEPRERLCCCSFFIEKILENVYILCSSYILCSCRKTSANMVANTFTDITTKPPILSPWTNSEASRK